MPTKKYISHFSRSPFSLRLTIALLIVWSTAQAQPSTKIEQQLQQEQDRSAGAKQKRFDLLSKALEKNAPATTKTFAAPMASGAASLQSFETQSARKPNVDPADELLQRALYEVVLRNNSEVIKLHDGKRLFVATQAQYARLKSFVLLGWEGNDQLYASGFVLPSCVIGRENAQAAIDRISRQLAIPVALSAPTTLVQQRQREEQAARQLLTASSSAAQTKSSPSREPVCDETRMRVSIFYPKGRVGAEELSVELARALVDVVKVHQAPFKPARRTREFDIDLREFR